MAMRNKSSSYDTRFKAFLDDARSTDRLRSLTVRSSDSPLINFSSNDYLGLSRHPALIERACEWTQKWGAGSTASRLVAGSLEIHHRVEAKLARLKGTEAALIFATGYQANASIPQALFAPDTLGQDALVFCDKLNHASLHHGCAAAGVRQIRFAHNDLNHLEELLSKNAPRSTARFIITESVFSMDGDRVDLQSLVNLAERFDAFLYVDEAHATGVLGQGGMGLAGAVHGQVDLVMGTFGKALGGFGAYVACSQTLKDYLINRCGGFIYSTAPPPGVLGAMDAALDLVPSMGDERTTLHANADELRRVLHDAGIDTAASSSQIVPAIMGSEEATLAASRHLQDHGIYGVAIRPPTVPRSSSRVRFALSASHSDQDMQRLFDAVTSLRQQP